MELIQVLRNIVYKPAYLFMLIVVLCIRASAQDQRSAPLPSSELGRENLSRVAASAAELKIVLLRDPGLMVELRRWIAKDATDHGQVISDSDLTNDAILERLVADIQFRSVATQLVQRYGYLTPKVNPDSEIGKEQELVLVERAKLIAQRQQQDLAKAGLQNSQNPQNSPLCDPRISPNCNATQSILPVPNGQGQQQQPPAQIGTPTDQGAPDQQDLLPSEPRSTESPLDRAQLMQTGATQTNSSYSPLEMSGRTQSAQASNGFDTNSSGDQSELTRLRQALSRSEDFGGGGGLIGEPGGSASLQDVFAAYGVGRGGSFGVPGSSTSEFFDRDQQAPPGMSPVIPILSSTQRYRRSMLFQPPELTRARSPYDDIPSLYDMYIQAVSHPTTPRRFGSEVFDNGTRDPQFIPTDLPAGPDYIVGPGDGLSVDLWGGVSQRFFRTVDREGRINLPEAGPVLVSGKSLADIQQDLQRILRSQFRDVSAEVSLARLRTIRVYEVGDVANPGAYDISSLSTPLNALFAAGGPTPKGSLRIVKHFRGNQLLQDVDMYDLLLRGVKSDMLRLDNGDTVVVPPAGPQVTVEGMVRRPAIYELKDEKSLASVLELAGGLLPTAALRHIEVQRLVAHDKQTMLSLDIPEVNDSSEVTKKLEGFRVHDGDRIRVFPIAPYNQDVIYLDGHVIRPGLYSYRENMRVTDVIASYKDLLPEPASKYAEIIRLNAPDFHPTVESFDLAAALDNPSQAPLLHSMDTIRVFSRFDFENPPTVSVWGEVRMPGTYRTSGQIRLGDAVHLAGGLAPDAQTADAQVFRYLPDGKFKIFSVNLTEALAGDPTENIRLQPRDRLLIHRNPDSVEPATAYIQGEVVRPGRYPLTTNMKAGDLIRVAGGLKPSADTNLADVTNFQYTNQSTLTGQHEVIAISAALSGESKADVAVHNGDVVTIRQLPGWNDLGASISVRGEVKHAGTYGIHPGERLSSIIERAGGFQPGAYPYGVILQRTQVRELEARDRDQMIIRVTDEQARLQQLPESDPGKKRSKDMAIQQWQTTLEQLSSNPPIGRVAVRISADLNAWKSTAADIEVRAGDTLVVPKNPDYVMVTGQVYNPTAVSYRHGKSANWYLSQSGGPTQLANRKAIFVIRADGSVLGTSNGLLTGSSLNAELRPGDTVVVPEKAIGGGIQWQMVFLAAQVASSIISTAFIAAHY